MDAWEALFWASETVAAYALFGYGPVALVLARALPGPPIRKPDAGWAWPRLSVVIAAHDEQDVIVAKIANTFNCGYPADLLEVIVVADGSRDETARLARDAGAIVLHDPLRRGKAHAVSRGISLATGDVVVLTDANAMFYPGTLHALAEPFCDPSVGGVAGSKRVRASGARPEGAYWRLENVLRRADSRIWSVMGAAGEVLAIRRDRFPALEPDTILDDFMISMRLVQLGYRVVHAPEASAIEYGHPGIRGELERRARIVAGGHQAVFRLGLLLERPVRVWFPYLSHRILRWVAAPWLLASGLIANVVLAVVGAPLYDFLLALQLGFWGLAALGGVIVALRANPGPLALPWQVLLYWCAALAGAWRFYGRRQSSVWERVPRRAT